MTTGFRRYIILALTLAFLSTALVFQADAQTRKKKKSRRSKPAVAQPVITNPTIAPPTGTAPSDDIKVISTADQTTQESADTVEQTAPAKKKQAPARTSSSDSSEMQSTINQLSDQVKTLNNKLTQMQENDRYLLDMERLTRAEQRSEGLRSQLIDIQSKIADYQSKLEQIEYNLKPENIDRSTQGYGLTRPEEARESRKRQLEREKANTLAQLNILESSKVRLESAIGNADAEVELLKQKLSQQRDEKAFDEMSGRPANPKKPD